MAKLLLIEDVYNLGRSGDIVSVKPGYARNYLLPQKLAEVADKTAIRRQKDLQEAREKKASDDRKEALSLSEKLSPLTLETTVKVDHEGHMYGSVSAQDIVDLLASQHSLSLDKHFVALKHPIKKVGVHTVEFKLKEGIEASLTLKIMAEGQQ